MMKSDRYQSEDQPQQRSISSEMQGGKNLTINVVDSLPSSGDYAKSSLPNIEVSVFSPIDRLEKGLVSNELGFGIRDPCTE